MKTMIENLTRWRRTSRDIKSIGNRQAGFSLIELLVVLVILGLIGGLVVPDIIGNTEKAKYKAAVAKIVSLSGAVDRYYLDNGQPPNRLEELVNDPGNADFWDGPYIKSSELTDPWGNEWVYNYPGDHGEYDITTYAKDQTQGGEGLNADINSWE